jgi:hypothetical protein
MRLCRKLGDQINDFHAGSALGSEIAGLGRLVYSSRVPRVANSEKARPQPTQANGGK